jgi:hypothetical protein
MAAYGDHSLAADTYQPARQHRRQRHHVRRTSSGSGRPGGGPEAIASTYLCLIEELGHEKAGRRLGIRINVPRSPTLAELQEAARRDGISMIYLTVDGPR